MPRLRLASIVLAASLAPGACAISPVCDEPGAVCLDADDVTQVRVGFVADALAIVDVDGDGGLDIVAASGPAGTVSIVWSTEWFKGAATTWSIDQEVAELVVDDLDGDGLLDLATALPRSDAVAVVRGRGGRTFAEPQRFAAGAVPRALVAADLDGTGPPELVTGNLGDGTISVLRGFVAEPAIVVGPGPRALAAGDVGGDGQVDVAVALADADAVQILLGDGHGGLWPGPLHAVGAAPVAMVAADLDGDGGLDLATADSLDDTVSLLWSDGAGGHEARRAWPTVALPSALVAVPEQPQPVLGVLSETTSTIERLDPRSGASVRGVLAGKPRALMTLLGGLVTGGRAVSSLGPGQGLVLTELWQRSYVKWVWPVDLDSDGVDELLLVHEDGEPGVMTLRDGDGDETAVAVPVGLEAPMSVRTGDVTGDGRIDVLLRDGQRLAVLVQQPDGELRAGEVQEFSDVEGFWPADVDGDEVAEVLVLMTRDAGSELRVYGGDAAGDLTLLHGLVFPEPMEGLRVIDGDGDATPDVLLSFSEADGYLYLEDLYGPARGLSGWPYCLDLLADIDGNGRLDAVCCETEFFVAYDIFTPAVEAADETRVERIDATCRSVRAMDLDRDGDLELLTYDYGGVPGEYISRLTPWVRGVGTWIALGARNLIQTGFRTNQSFVDLDGDGTQDIMLHSDAGIVAARIDLGPVLVPQELTRLSSRPNLRFGDLDGDGAADLLAYGDTLAVARGDGEGNFGPLSHVWDLRDSSRARSISDAQLIAADAGPARVVWASHFDGDPMVTINLAELDFTGVHERVSLGDIHAGYAHIFLADLDSDGRRDLLALDASYYLTAVIQRAGENGEFGAPNFHVFDDRRIAIGFGIHDIDRDGYLDVAALLHLGPDLNYGVYVFPGRGDGGFGPGQLWSHYHRPLLGHEAVRLVFGDFDRDGHVELVVRDGLGELLWVRGGAQADARVLFRNVDAFAAADLNRDGHPELLVARRRPFSGDTITLRISRPRPEGGLGFEVFVVPTSGVREIHTADIDGDDALDIALVDDPGVTIVRRGR